MVALYSLAWQLKPLFSPFFMLGIFGTHLAADVGKSCSEREFKDLVTHLRKIISSEPAQSIHQGLEVSRYGILIYKRCSEEAAQQPGPFPQSPRAAMGGCGSLLGHSLAANVDSIGTD